MPENPRVEYSKPPIDEGLCQFALSSPPEWSIATPGLLYEALREEYPALPEAQDQFAASFAANPDEAKGGANIALQRGGQRFIFQNDEKNRLLVINQQLVSANSLRPYEGWPDLRARFERSLEMMQSVVALSSVEKVTIRYINRITIPTDEPFDTNDYFNYSIRTAQHGIAEILGFVNRVESRLDDGGTTVSTTFASLASEAGSNSSFLLDLELGKALPPGNQGFESAFKVADELKAIENAEFEALITEKTRDLFR